MSKNTSPNVSEEVVQEFFESFGDLFDDLVNNIEELNKLKRKPEPEETLGTFRVLHTIKGNLVMVELPEISEMVHYLENILDEIGREGIPYSEEIGDVILLCIDEVQVMAKKAFDGHPQSQEFALVGNVINHINTTDTIKRNEALEVALNLLDPFKKKNAMKKLDTHKYQSADSQPSNTYSNTYITSGEVELLPKEHQQPFTSESGYEYVTDDLCFFEKIAFAINFRLKSSSKRIATTTRVAIEMNKLAGNKVNEKQLIAASFLLNFGVSLLPMSINTKDSITDEEHQQIEKNPIVSSKLLDNMPYWQEAKQMILQVHEQVNGAGYPNKLTAKEICEGAKILSIAQAFASTLYSRPSHRLTSRTIMASILEINKGIDIRYPQEWIVIFNDAIKQMHSKGLFV